MKKNYAHNYFQQKTEMRALCSQVKKHDFFDFLGRPFSKMDILKMSKNDLLIFKKSIFPSFSSFNDPCQLIPSYLFS